MRCDKNAGVIASVLRDQAPRRPRAVQQALQIHSELSCIRSMNVVEAGKLVATSHSNLAPVNMEARSTSRGAHTHGDADGRCHGVCC